MSDKHDTPCEHIRSSLRFSPDGSIKPCCVYTGDLGHLEDVSDLNGFWERDDRLTRLKSTDARGEWVLPGCSVCMKRESDGKLSRKQAIQRITSQHPAFGEDDGKLKYMEISFGNTCNLSCAMCSSQYSSSWLKHEIEFKKENDWVYPHRSWTAPYDKIDMICDAMEDVQIVEILGGEPLYDKRFRYWLEKLDSRDRLTNLEVNIVTNFTVIDDRMSALLGKIKRLQLNISIDGIGKHYEWIRGFEFKQLESNINAYLPRLIPKDRICIFNCVVTSYNLGNLVDYYRWMFDLMERHDTCIRPFLLVCYKEHMDPNLSIDAKRFTDDFETIKHMVLSQHRYSAIIKDQCLLELTNLMKHLSNDAITKDAGVLSRNRKWHELLVRMRGWDIYDS